MQQLEKRKSPDFSRFRIPTTVGRPENLATLKGLEPSTSAVTERAWKPFQADL
jgi:hypothetical protein